MAHLLDRPRARRLLLPAAMIGNGPPSKLTSFGTILAARVTSLPLRGDVLTVYDRHFTHTSLSPCTTRWSLNDTYFDHDVSRLSVFRYVHDTCNRFVTKP